MASSSSSVFGVHLMLDAPSVCRQVYMCQGCTNVSAVRYAYNNRWRLQVWCFSPCCHDHEHRRARIAGSTCQRPWPELGGALVSDVCVCVGVCPLQTRPLPPSCVRLTCTNLFITINGKRGMLSPSKVVSRSILWPRGMAYWMNLRFCAWVVLLADRLGGMAAGRSPGNCRPYLGDQDDGVCVCGVSDGIYSSRATLPKPLAQ